MTTPLQPTYQYDQNSPWVRLAVVESNLTAMEKAVNVAHLEMNRRLEGMNEFRADLDKKDATMVPRAEYQILLVDVRKLQDAQSRAEGRSSIATVVSIVSLLTAVGFAIAELLLK